jgi:hypothetical protein
VLSNDDTRRLEQTQTVYNSLVQEAANILHITEDELQGRMMNKAYTIG